MNLFRTRPDGKLDLQYLRICAVHALLDRKLIGKARAIELLAQRKVEKPARLVDLWLANPRKRFHGESVKPLNGLGFRLAARGVS